MQASGPAPFFSKKSHQQIVAAAVDQIKGRPIHPLKGSCSGYPLIPFWARSDACSRHCFNPAAKKTAFYLALATPLPPIALICCPHEFQAAPHARHGRGMHVIILIAFSNVTILLLRQYHASQL